MTRTLTRATVMVLLAGLMAVPARAEPPAEPARAPLFTKDRLATYVRDATASRAPQPVGQAAHEEKRDSILNGGLIGAVIGGVGGSVLIVASRGGRTTSRGRCGTCRCCRRGLVLPPGR